MAWVEASKRDNNWYLFNNLYHVRINELASRSAEHIKEYGVRRSGNKEYDSHVKDILMECMLKIPDIAEYVYNGVSVYLINGNDSKDIYRIIERHLSTWTEYLSTQIGPRDAPIEDLQKLNYLANVLYPVKYRNTTEDDAVSGFGQALRNVLGGEPLIKKKTVKENKQEEEEPKRNDTFSSLLEDYRNIQDFRRM